MSTLAEELRSILTGEVEDSETTLANASRDASIFKVTPQVVVFPQTVEDVKALVTFVTSSRDKKLSLTARSAGTDMSGGPLNDSIIVDFTRHFSHMGEVGADFATTEPGVFYRDFEKATLEHDLLLPSYTASREICTVGGMVANNSGGEKSLRYGKTTSYVRKLRAVLSDGNEYEFGALTATELEAKKKISGFEGALYRNMYSLIESNYDLIQAARPTVHKNSAGYALWDVWDKKAGTFDLSKVIAGAQGTLCLNTHITFSLIHPKKHSKLLVIFLHDLAPLAKIITTVLRYNPESFESYDDQTLKLAIRYFPSFLSLLGASNIFSLGLQFLPELWMTVTGGLPKLVLMAEFTGDSEDEVDTALMAAHAALLPFHLKTRVTRSEQEAKKYWTIRRESFNLLRHKIKDKHTAPFIDDISVSAEKLPEFLPRLNTILSQYKLTYTIAGHIGDGNFHIIPLMDLADPKERDIIFELAEKVYKLVFEFKGSITGEHNDGIIRSPYLQQQYGPIIYKLFGETKRIFDPTGIFNPRKKIGATIEYARDHIEAF